MTTDSGLIKNSKYSETLRSLKGLHFSVMTDAQLLELYDAVSQEITRRDIRQNIEEQS